MLSRKAYYYTIDPIPSGEITDERKVFTYGDVGWGDVLTAINGTTVTSDIIGNILSDGANNYTWNEGRQLVSLNHYGVISTFEYDASGLRTKRTTGNTTYTYTYDGNTLTGMTAGNKTLSFFYDSNGKPAAVKYNVAYYYYVTNALGDVVAIVNHNGVAMVTYTYDAWGNVRRYDGKFFGHIQPIPLPRLCV